VSASLHLRVNFTDKRSLSRSQRPFEKQIASAVGTLEHSRSRVRLPHIDFTPRAPWANLRIFYSESTQCLQVREDYTRHVKLRGMKIQCACVTSVGQDPDTRNVVFLCFEPYPFIKRPSIFFFQSPRVAAR